MAEGTLKRDMGEGRGCGMKGTRSVVAEQSNGERFNMDKTGFITARLETSVGSMVVA